MWVLDGLDQPDPYNTARATRLIAQAHLVQGEPERARRLLADALALFAAIGADQELADTHHLLAEAHDRLGDTDQARQHREQADRIVQPDT